VFRSLITQGRPPPADIHRDGLAKGALVKQRGIVPTGRERTFGQDDIIVSKTDEKGIITYANNSFLDIALYEEEEVLGQPHSMIRHPDMPRCVFKLLWDTILQGHEIFAYVKNMAKNGDHYWVFAHVTPSFGSDNKIVGFHSNRRRPDHHQVQVADGLYRKLKQVEDSSPDWKAGMAEATRLLQQTVAAANMEYDEFVLSI
jgi:PAS domain S-box-containing protein